MPFVIFPTWRGFKDQVTVVSKIPLTVAVKVSLCPHLSAALLGDRQTLTISLGGTGRIIGSKTRETNALLAGFDGLEAVNLTSCREITVMGGGSLELYTIPPAFPAVVLEHRLAEVVATIGTMATEINKCFRAMRFDPSPQTRVG